MALAHGQAPLEDRQSLREITLMESQLPHPKGRHSKVEGLRCRFRQTEDVCTHRTPFRKGTDLRETHK
jgi:hypothetical protein